MPSGERIWPFQVVAVGRGETLAGAIEAAANVARAVAQGQRDDHPPQIFLATTSVEVDSVGAEAEIGAAFIAVGCSALVGEGFPC